LALLSICLAVVPMGIFLFARHASASGLTLVGAFLLLTLLEVVVPWQIRNFRAHHHASRWIANYGIGLVGAVITAPIVYICLAWADRTRFGLCHHVPASLPIRVAVMVLAIDLERYWYHRIQHAVPVL
jgi:sterol desaturase/sphingolipid hydroxylase (fatty acid hydroxylase superfamily)